MIAKKYILANLQELNSAFLGSTDHKQALYLSKLAVLELCGWIELSMDDIIECHSKRHLRIMSNTKFVEDEIIKRTFGFEYDRHFRSMVMRTVGIVTCEKIERRMNAATLAKFTAQLGNLKTVRNSLAHTYLKGTGAAIAIDAPSVTKSRVGDLYDGMKAYDSALRGL